MTVPEAMNLHLNKPAQKKWYEKPFGIVFLMVLGTIIAAYFVYHLGLNAAKEETKYKEVQKGSAKPSSNIPQKIPSTSLPYKKSLKTVSMPTITAQNSNIFLGSNTGTVNQTINNFSEPKPIPLKDRLISCLDNINKKIIPALRAGTTSFEGKLLPYQLSELQKLSSEEGASNYISLTVKPGFILTKKNGTMYSVKFTLNPTLLTN